MRIRGDGSGRIRDDGSGRFRDDGSGRGPGGRAGSPGSHRRGFADRHRSGELDSLTKGSIARKIKLADQYRMREHGDVARRLDLHKHVTNIHNVTNITHVDNSWHVHHHYRGLVSPVYTHHSFRHRYHGPWYFPRYSWYPRWTTWVSWTWNYACDAYWDPRPIWCRPVVYVESPRWVYYEVPVWTPLPVVSSGTWVNVEPEEVGPHYDLQLLAVRFVDPGHPDEGLGPRFRVWFRNNGADPIGQPFDVMLFASYDPQLGPDLPQSGVRVASVGGGETQSVDIRLPAEVYAMRHDERGEPLPYTTLHVLVDAGQSIEETSTANNGASVAVEEILPVDPTAFEVDRTTAAGGEEIVLAGEGLGPEPGRVLVNLGQIEMEAEVLGWYDLGVRAVLPDLPLAAATQADLIVVRGDGAATNPLPITLTPAVGPEMVVPPPPE